MSAFWCHTALTLLTLLKPCAVKQSKKNYVLVRFLSTITKILLVAGLGDAGKVNAARMPSNFLLDYGISDYAESTTGQLISQAICSSAPK